MFFLWGLQNLRNHRYLSSFVKYIIGWVYSLNNKVNRVSESDLAILSRRLLRCIGTHLSDPDQPKSWILVKDLKGISADPPRPGCDL